MSSRLPIEPLRAFIHAAEIGSFKSAAQRLNLSSGAISQRIAQLEQYLGTLLFKRKVRMILLTKDGHQLLEDMRGPILDIERALNKTAWEKRQTTITVETIPSFASYWLMQRLGTFLDSHPDIKIEVKTSTVLSDLRKTDIDLAIRYSSGKYSGLISKPLFSPDLVMVGSPSLFADDVPVTAIDCLRYPLLQDGSLNEWKRWIKKNKLQNGRVNWGPTFADDGLMLIAACEGQGLAILRDFYTDEAVRNNKLKVVFQHPVTATHTYHLVGLPQTFDRREIRLFDEWLHSQIRPNHG